MSEIVDNSPEMALDDPRIQEILTGTKPAAAEPAQKTDVKPDVSSASTQHAAPNEESKDPKHLEAQIQGLKAELARKKGNAELVETLRAEVEALKTEREKAKAQPPDNEFAWMQKLEVKDLAKKQTDWDDELADARARYAHAEENGNEKEIERQGQRILRAKRTIAAFREEVLDRTNRQRVAEDEARTEMVSIREEVDDMRGALSELYPDFADESTELWKAGNEEFNNHPALMTRLGALGEVVAAAMAIVRNPGLVAAPASPAARKEVIGSIEKAVKKSLSTGASAPTTQRSVDWSGSINSGEDLAKFNQMIDRFKGG